MRKGEAALQGQKPHFCLRRKTQSSPHGHGFVSGFVRAGGGRHHLCARYSDAWPGYTLFRRTSQLEAFYLSGALMDDCQAAQQPLLFVSWVPACTVFLSLSQSAVWLEEEVTKFNRGT